MYIPKLITLDESGHILASATQAALSTLRDWRLWIVLGLTATLLTIAAQIPLHYTIKVGQEDGLGGDLPLVAGFYPPEHDVHGYFRWTRDRAMIRLPGVGQRALQIMLKVFPISNEVVQRGPKELELWSAGRKLVSLPVHPAGAVYHFILPPAPDGSGDQAFEIHNATFTPTGDQRSIGSPVDTIAVSSFASLAFPAWHSGLAWLFVALSLWLALRTAGFSSQATLTLLLPITLLLGLAAILDPPRTGFGALPALVASTFGWLLLIVLRVTIPTLYERYRIPYTDRTLRWLLLIAFIVFGLRYGGKIYPDSMPGDIGFHVNRFTDVIRGGVLLLSRNRGVDFPYPSTFYLLLAPFSLLGFSPDTLLRLIGAMLDAVSPFLVYTIAATRGYSRKTGTSQRGDGFSCSTADFAVVAAGIYSLSASGFMVEWWNFSTHIFTQFAHLLLITGVVLFWRRSASDGLSHTTSQANARPWLAILGLCLLQIFVYLGHFGFWINTSLLGGIALVVLLIAVLRRRVDRQRVRILLVSFVLAQITSLLFFYSAYAQLFFDQARIAATGGLTGLAGRTAVPFAILWNTLWDAGLRVHFGLFPVPLALGGLALFWQRTIGNPRQADRHQHKKQENLALPAPYFSITPFLIASTFLIGLCFAVLPFISGSSLATRWLMFSAWAIAVSAAFAARCLWYKGFAARLLVCIIGSYMVWITASQWLSALAWRIRPPEPF